MSTVLVVGTLAVDYIGAYSGSFETLQNAADLNISLTLEELTASFGGCAINIAVGLSRLGHQALPFALTGETLNPSYRDHLAEIGVSLDGLIPLPEYRLSSQCFIVTDSEGNQFTSFYPGPSRSPKYANLLERFVQDRANEIDGVVLAPDVGSNMRTSIEICKRFNLPFLSDPGQCLNDFTDSQTQFLVDRSSVICVNNHEFDLLHARVKNLDSVAVLIKTLGEHGVEVIQAKRSQEVESVKSEHPLDPTGCGDAFRAGLVHARLLGNSWVDACKIAATLASIAIEHRGTQTYLTDNLEDRVMQYWGLDIHSNPNKIHRLFDSDD